MEISDPRLHLPVIREIQYPNPEASLCTKGGVAWVEQYQFGMSTVTFHLELKWVCQLQR